MRVQLWSSNYDPEPQGIAPLSGMLARGLKAIGHDVSVVAAHPHYPQPAWGTRRRPYREVRNGIPVLRLPVWAGRHSGLARVRQELSITASHALIAPLIPRPDIIIGVTPSFPALSVAMSYCKAHRIPWVMWLQDIVTDGAAATAQLDEGQLLRAARRFERATYRSADRIVVISDAFRRNLALKGVPDEHMVRIFNPTSRAASEPNDIDALDEHRPRVLAMGNIGHTQGLDAIVRAFEGSEALAALDAELHIAGAGMAADAVRQAISSDRVVMPGIYYGDDLLPVLRNTTLGLVSQRPRIAEFNLPSKLMNYMTHGIPVLASVNPQSETAKILHESGGGWVTDAVDPTAFAKKAAEVLRDRPALKAAGLAGFHYAQREFSAATVAERFSAVLEDVVVRGSRGKTLSYVPHADPESGAQRVGVVPGRRS